METHGVIAFGSQPSESLRKVKQEGKGKKVLGQASHVRDVIQEVKEVTPDTATQVLPGNLKI